MGEKVHYNIDLTVQVSLTSREIEIIKMACHEMSSKEIGDKLCISTRTVEKHRKRIMEKPILKILLG